jgi:protein involved in ribonucleotide reduction
MESNKNVYIRAFVVPLTLAVIYAGANAFTAKYATAQQYHEVQKVIVEMRTMYSATKEDVAEIKNKIELLDSRLRQVGK